jgi:hypothetical protein
MIPSRSYRHKKMPGAAAGQKIEKQCSHYNSGLLVAIG